MSFDADDAKERVRQAVDLVELISSHLDLRRQGRMYVGICPWHDDRRPSLQVNPERQTWKCWVCNVGGDLFSFVMQREGVSFPEALAMLAERGGVPLRRSGPGPRPGSAADKQTLYQALAWAEQQFQQCLAHAAEAEPARRYLAERGISPSSIERFRLGFSPNRWQWLLDRARSTPFSSEVLEAAGLVGKGDGSGQYYDRFKGRVIFPIRNVEGRAVAFGGRILPEWAGDRTGKYVNSPETRVFTKSDLLYGLDLAREQVGKSRHLTVVEGYTDVVMAHQLGLGDVTAVLGTSLGSSHIKLLRRFADRVTLVLDGDDAGRRRTNEILDLFVAQPIDLRVLTLPSGLDPCDYLLEYGAEAFGQLRDQAPDALQHKVESATAGLRWDEPHESNRALEEILRTLAQAMRFESDPTSMRWLRAHQMLARLARQFRVDESVMRRRLQELQRSSTSRRDEALTEPHLPSGERPSPRCQELLELFCLEPELVHEAVCRIAVDDLPTAVGRSLYSIWVELSQRRPRVEFAQVMTAVDDAELKSILVELDESAHRKAAPSQLTPGERLEMLASGFERDRAERERRDKLSSLDQSRDHQEEYALLEQIVALKRDRQGGSAPTDG